MQRELILSILIFVLSCIGSFFSYYSILRHTVNENTLASGISSGRHNYTIHETGKCIGWANYELVQKNDISEIKSGGKFNLKYEEQVFPVDYAFESSFNSIGQLGGAILKINVKDSFILIGSTNIDPIKVTIKSNLMVTQREFVFSIPGPVELKKSGRDNFSITGLTLNKIQNVPVKLPLEIVERDSMPCDEKKLSFFDITVLIESVKTLYGGYVKL